MENYKYFKIKNTNVQDVEELLYENKIEYKKYTKWRENALQWDVPRLTVHLLK